MKEVEKEVNVIAEATKSAQRLVAKYTGNIDDLTDFAKQTDLHDVEQGIKRLMQYSEACWLVTSVAVYSLIYDQQMYQQSGLRWNEYVKESRERLGIDYGEMGKCLSSARFFIRYHKELVKAGWTPIGSSRKLSCAEYALRLTGSLDEVIDHLCKDSLREFTSWYQSFKFAKAIEGCMTPRNDIVITRTKVLVGGIEPVKISDMLTKDDQQSLQEYIMQIYHAIKDGYIPAIIPVRDTQEASNLVLLRDKQREHLI